MSLKNQRAEMVDDYNRSMRAEIKQLRAEVARLTAAVLTASLGASAREAENERLRADNEWLRGIMRNAIAAQDFEIARAALEPKP